MINHKKKHILNLCLICIIMILSGCAKTQEQTKVDSANTTKISKTNLTQVIAFGDSYSDNGGANRCSTEIVNSENAPEAAFIKPGEVYWKNRYSNGKTAVEILAEQLNVFLTNFATGGATTGESNYSAWMDTLKNSGLLGQITEFEESLAGKQADFEALYFIFASANDYYYFMDFELPGKIEAVADQAVDNLKTAVRRLANLGAKKIFVVNSSDLTLVPYEISMNHEKEAAAFRDYVNNKLPQEMNILSELLEVTIQVFDMKKASDEIVKNAKDYGLSILDKPCQPTYPEIKTANTEEDSYYFWDEWHYTRAVHKILGEKMYNELK